MNSKEAIVFTLTLPRLAAIIAPPSSHSETASKGSGGMRLAQTTKDTMFGVATRLLTRLAAAQLSPAIRTIITAIGLVLVSCSDPMMPMPTKAMQDASHAVVRNLFGKQHKAQSRGKESLTLDDHRGKPGRDANGHGKEQQTKLDQPKENAEQNDVLPTGIRAWQKEDGRKHHQRESDASKEEWWHTLKAPFDDDEIEAPDGGHQNHGQNVGRPHHSGFCGGQDHEAWPALTIRSCAIRRWLVSSLFISMLASWPSATTIRPLMMV